MNKRPLAGLSGGGTVLDEADEIIDAVKSGAIRHFLRLKVPMRQKSPYAANPSEMEMICGGIIMVRRAQNVHIYFFTKNENGAYEYAVLQRTDDTGIFQGASGGIRNAESPGQAALRVAAYEAGVPEGTALFALTSMGYAPVTIFGAHAEEWGCDVVVVPIYFFAMQIKDITFSEQHYSVRWCPFDEAEKLFTFESQKTGLWELNEWLLRGNLKLLE